MRTTSLIVSGTTRLAAFLLMPIAVTLGNVAASEKRSIPKEFKEIVRDQVNPLPTPTDEEKRRGYLVFTRPEPGDIYQASAPLREEITNRIATCVTPGEIANVNFALHALRDLKQVRVDVGPFRGRDVQPWPRDLRHVRCWPQRTGWRSSTYHVIPELLVKREQVDLAAGRTQQYYLRVDVPKNAKPGTYRAVVSVATSEGKSDPLAIELTVLPFTLLWPPHIIFGLYPDTGGWPASAEVKADIMRRIHRQGINALVMYPFDYSKWTYQDGKVTADLSEFSHMMALYKQAGLTGPLVMSVQGISGHIRQWVPDALTQDGDYTPEAVDATRQILMLIAEEAKKHHWPPYVLHAVDEPSGGKKMKAAVRIAKVISDAGFDMFSTIWRPGPLDPYLKYRCHNCIHYSCFPSEKATARLREDALKAGDVFWLYGTGCYVNGGIIQDGNIIANRYMGGTFFWRTQATGCWAWTFMRARGDPYNDLDGTGREPKDQMIVYPPVAPDTGFTPTLQWEGIRKGIDDYRYFHTLAVTIRKAKESGKRGLVPKADAIERQFHRMIQGMPWHHARSGQYPTGDITNADLVANRKQVARWICALLEMMGDDR